MEHGHAPVRRALTGLASATPPKRPNLDHRLLASHRRSPRRQAKQYPVDVAHRPSGANAGRGAPRTKLIHIDDDVSERQLEPHCDPPSEPQFKSRNAEPHKTTCEPLHQPPREKPQNPPREPPREQAHQPVHTESLNFARLDVTNYVIRLECRLQEAKHEHNRMRNEIQAIQQASDSYT